MQKKGAVKETDKANTSGTPQKADSQMCRPLSVVTRSSPWALAWCTCSAYILDMICLTFESLGFHRGSAPTNTGGSPAPDPLRRLAPPSPPPPPWKLARKCRTMGAEGARSKFCLNQ